MFHKHACIVYCICIEVTEWNFLARTRTGQEKMG